jgi:hypothetical protein
VSLPAAEHAPAHGAGALRFERVAPEDVRDAAVAFFWRMRAWPYPDLESYYRYWDWRYSGLSEERPTVWVARHGSAIVGHIAVYFRRCRLDGHAVRIGVPGNFLVDTTHRDTMIGARLASSPRALVRDGEIDMLLAYGNRIAHAMFIRLGARDLGFMKSFVDIRQWAPVLSRRVPGGAALAPLVSAASRLRKALRGRARPRDLRHFRIDELDRAALLGIDKSHWRAPNGNLVEDATPRYLADRFLACPVRRHRVFGIFDRVSGALQGLVATEGTTRVKVWTCEVNEDVLTEVEAVNLALDALPDAESVLVPLLPKSHIGKQFASVGFLRERFMDDVEANTSWSACWRDSHPLASRFADVATWKLWYSWSHH